MMKFIRQSDLLLFCTVIVLCGMGFAALYSIGLGKEANDFSLLTHQAVTFGVGMVCISVVSIFQYRMLRNFSPVVYGCALVLLCAVLVVGSTLRGTRGWFAWGSVTFQPVELAKIGLIMMLAWYFSSYTRQVGRLKHIIVSGSIALAPIAAVLLQPDLGSAAILFAIWFGMVLMSGIPRRYILSITIGLCVVAVMSWVFVIKDYQRARVISFLAPTHDTQGKSYNVRQAQIAIGSGEWFGRGLGYGSQSHLRFLPESQTDFIFSVLAEELGFFGIALLFFFWYLLFCRLIRIMRLASDDFALYCVLGVTLMLFSHMFINIGGNLGIVPLTGIVLPFVSYGGSALLIDLIAIGLVESIHIHSV